MPNREMKLAYFCYPGCIVVANTLRQVHGDYETVAHVDYSGVIRYYVKDVAMEYRKAINGMAAKERDNFHQKYLADVVSGDYGRWLRVWELYDLYDLYDAMPFRELLKRKGNLWDLSPEEMYSRYMELIKARWGGELPTT